MIAQIYPSVLQAESGRGYAGCLEGCFQGHRGKAMHDVGYGLPRNHIPRTRMNNAPNTLILKMQPARWACKV